MRIIKFHSGKRSMTAKSHNQRRQSDHFSLREKWSFATGVQLQNEI